ncbi:MAG: ribonuclease Z [Lachnospiraceae bacterium]|nr:ribonuclease Z [Lachnospiraceae bacterium]
MIDVCLLGTGGMMPLPHRALTSLMLRYNGMNVLVDCGEGTQVSIKQQGWSVKPIDVICFTHFHADHISGLPGLLLTLGNAERTEPVTMIGPKRLEKIVNALRMIAPELPFPIRFIELEQDQESFEINGLKIHAFKVQHNITCYGYSFELERAGKFDVERARALEIPMKLWNPLQKGETIEDGGITYTPDMVLGAPRKGIKLTYCTDSRPTDSIVENARESDLLICEGMYGEPDKEEKAKEHKHMTFYEAAAMAKKAEVKEMWLTHYSPSLVRPQDYEEQVRKVFANTIVAKDRRTTTLLFEEG